MVIQSTSMDPATRKRVALRKGQTTPFVDLVRGTQPGARIEIVENAGHFTQIEAAGEVNRLIADFART
jgi:pimeloyl-ACP methyl ester carboxylesterase